MARSALLVLLTLLTLFVAVLILLTRLALLVRLALLLAGLLARLRLVLVLRLLIVLARLVVLVRHYVLQGGLSPAFGEPLLAAIVPQKSHSSQGFWTLFEKLHSQAACPVSRPQRALFSDPGGAI
jgi:hypothetical protein